MKLAQLLRHSRRHKLYQLVVDGFYNGIILGLNMDTLSKLSIDPGARCACPRMTVQDDRQAAISKQRDFLGTKQTTANPGLHEHRGATT